MAILRGEKLPFEVGEDTDVREAFETAVRNNQLNMAMHYVVLLFEELDERLDKLNDKVGKQTAVKVPANSELPKKKVSKKTSTKKVPVVEDEAVE